MAMNRFQEMGKPISFFCDHAIFSKVLHLYVSSLSRVFIFLIKSNQCLKFVLYLLSVTNSYHLSYFRTLLVFYYNLHVSRKLKKEVLIRNRLNNARVCYSIIYDVNFIKLRQHFLAVSLIVQMNWMALLPRFQSTAISCHQR